VTSRYYFKFSSLFIIGTKRQKVALILKTPCNLPGLLRVKCVWHCFGDLKVDGAIDLINPGQVLEMLEQESGAKDQNKSVVRGFGG